MFFLQEEGSKVKGCKRVRDRNSLGDDKIKGLQSLLLSAQSNVCKSPNAEVRCSQGCCIWESTSWNAWGQVLTVWGTAGKETKTLMERTAG